MDPNQGPDVPDQVRCVTCNSVGTTTTLLPCGLHSRCLACRQGPSSRSECEKCLAATRSNSPVAGPSRGEVPVSLPSTSAGGSTPFQPPKRAPKKRKAPAKIAADAQIAHVIPDDKGYKCLICGKVFKSRSNKTYHKYCDTTIPKPFKCDICKRVCSRLCFFACNLSFFNI